MADPTRHPQALDAARRWARHHGHPAPDDRMLHAYGEQVLAALSAPPPGEGLHRQPAYDAVLKVIRRLPPRSADPYGQAAENGRVWRAVEAALTAMNVPDGPAGPSGDPGG